MWVEPLWTHAQFIVTFSPVGQGQDATDSLVFFPINYLIYFYYTFVILRSLSVISAWSLIISLFKNVGCISNIHSHSA